MKGHVVFLLMFSFLFISGCTLLKNEIPGQAKQTSQSFWGCDLSNKNYDCPGDQYSCLKLSLGYVCAVANSTCESSRDCKNNEYCSWIDNKCVRLSSTR